MTKIKKIAIAHRGEIALRILHTASEMDIKTVALHSDLDKNLLHIARADESINLGDGAPENNYLNINAILSALEKTDCDAIHPGYGFIAEKPNFVKRIEDAGKIFIGPDAALIALAEDRIAFRKFMHEQGITCVPGLYASIDNLDNDLLDEAKKLGFPLIIKEARGGGGRLLKIVYKESALAKEIDELKTKALNQSEDVKVYFEKFIHNPRHLELQILGDNYGNVIHLGIRDCSIQHWNTKDIEESFPLDGHDFDFNSLAEQCVNICKELKYSGAGTFEFLFDGRECYFMEMNTRLQVGHSVNELTTNVDLVKEQIKVADGEKLSINQNDIQPHGHSIECRIYAVDPKTFQKSKGLIQDLHIPGGPGIRVDTHIYTGYIIPERYDKLILKISAHSETREECINRMQLALEETVISGIKTNIPLLQLILSDPHYIANDFNLSLLEKKIGIRQQDE